MKPAHDPEVFRARLLALRREDPLAKAAAERLETPFVAHAQLGRRLAFGRTKTFGRLR